MEKLTAKVEKNLEKVINFGELAFLIEVTCVGAEDGTPTTKVACIEIADGLTGKQRELANTLLNALGDIIETEGCGNPEDVVSISFDEDDEVYFVNGELLCFSTNVVFE